MAIGMIAMTGLLTLQPGTDAVLMSTMCQSVVGDLAGQICIVHHSGVYFQGKSYGAAWSNNVTPVGQI